MTAPFTRQDAKQRAVGARNAAEVWAAVVTERSAFVEKYMGADAVAAERCVEVARRELAHQRMQAEAYERIARGEDPYP